MEHKTISGQIAKLSALFKTKLMGKNSSLLLVMMGLIGILLISVPSFLPEKENGDTPEVTIQEEADYAVHLSLQLEEILGKMEGVGEIKVMVTLKQDSSYVYATDLAQNDQQKETLVEQQTEQKHVILEQDGEEQALVSTRFAPQVEGVIIVCRGGSDPVVVNKLTDAVTAALGIGSNRVAVSNMGLTE